MAPSENLKRVAIYLRKSREDEKLEKELGKGETLSLHRRDLLKYANKNTLDVIKIYEELVSGESLLYRTAMLELLKEVEQGAYDGVLCMDLQRLGRGDMEEQGMILKAFKNSSTKIITPDKIYDLDNEFDEEYSEFEAFMGRKEYKMINKRLRRGVLRSVASGNYNGPWRPFGYEIKELKDGRSLDIKEDEASIVQLIFSWYVEESIGSYIIADRLNSMGIKTTKGNKWSGNSVAELLKNPLYYGKIAYNRRFGYRSSNKKKAVKNRNSIEWLIYDGKHAGIITEEIYDKAMTIMRTYHKSPIKSTAECVNPLAGIVLCGVCGSKMVYRTYNTQASLPHMICRQKCGNKSAKFALIEKAIMDQIRLLLENKRIESTLHLDKSDRFMDKYKIEISALQRQFDDIQKQRKNAYDFFEKEIYSMEVFNERFKLLNERMENISNEMQITKKVYAAHCQVKDQNISIKTIESVLEAYDTATPYEKNLLLKSIIEKAVYNKDSKAREDNFAILIYTRV